MHSLKLRLPLHQHVIAQNACITVYVFSIYTRYIAQFFSIGNGYIVLSGISLLRNTDGAKIKIEPPLTKRVDINANKMLILLRLFCLSVNS